MPIILSKWVFENLSAYRGNSLNHAARKQLALGFDKYFNELPNELRAPKTEYFNEKLCHILAIHFRILYRCARGGDDCITTIDNQNLIEFANNYYTLTDWIFFQGDNPAISTKILKSLRGFIQFIELLPVNINEYFMDGDLKTAYDVKGFHDQLCELQSEMEQQTHKKMGISFFKKTVSYRNKNIANIDMRAGSSLQLTPVAHSTNVSNYR